MAFGRRSCLCRNVAGWIFLLAGVGGSRTRRWGLLGEGSRLTWERGQRDLEGDGGPMVGQALGSAEVPGQWKTVRVEGGWRTEERATLEVCVGTGVGQLSSVHLTGLGCLVEWEKDSDLYGRWYITVVKFRIYRNKRTPEVKSRGFGSDGKYLLGIYNQWVQPKSCCQGLEVGW